MNVMPKKSTSLSTPEPVPGAGFQPLKQLVISSVEQLKAISDPLRLNILELIIRDALTVKQIASRLDQPPTRLYYHIAELEKGGFVTVVDTRVKSGIIEKYYRTSAENITIDHKLLNASGDEESIVPELLSVVFDTTAQEITRSMAAGLVNLNDLTTGKSTGMILLRSLFNIPRENVAMFIEKFTALLVELDAQRDQPGADFVSYGCMIAFYPRVSKEKPDETNRTVTIT
jgi:DNA-binding transcriptional ArsR family regulator